MSGNDSIWPYASEEEIWVNFYWQKHYRDEITGCKICLNDGWFIPDLNGRFNCICPEGMKRRKENERP